MTRTPHDTHARRAREPKPPIAPEHQEQAALMEWAGYHQARYPELAALLHIPNGEKRDPRTAARLKAMGVRAGVPDLFLAVPRGGFHGLFVELKRRRKGSVDKDQREWHVRLRAQGYRVAVCRGWEAARDAVVDYLTSVEGR